jgi:hypothetical protein
MKTHSPDSPRNPLGSSGAKGVSSGSNYNSSGNVLIALHERLLSLSFDAYLQVIANLLYQLGYRDVRPSGRLDWRGRNKGGGYDLTATLVDGIPQSSGPYSRRVVISAKQFDATNRIFQRQVDELRGAAIRVGANEALLITSGILSRAIDHEGIASPLAPVRLMDGEELISLLIQHGIGITDSFGLDESFFKKLEHEALGNRQSDCLGSTDLLLTVSLNRVPKNRQNPLPKERLASVPQKRRDGGTAAILRQLSKSG